ncbi:MAG: DUF6226 family protein [Ilumatobacteraceae bacterium]
MDRFAQLLAAVETAFETTGRDLSPWDDPHPDRSPLDEEYSRLLDPAKWRIVGARVDAWVEALVGAGLADVERDATVDWVDDPGTISYRTDRLAPRRDGAVPLVVRRNRIEGVDGAGITLGAGAPAVVVESIPDCGCDACDSGSQDVLDQVDECIGGIVRGEFRHLRRRVKRPPRPPGFRFVATTANPAAAAMPAPPPPFAETWAMPDVQTITVVTAGCWSAKGSFGRGEVDAALANPTGWRETTGPPWLG